MIILNNNSFAEKEEELKNYDVPQFVGYAKKYKRKINLYDLNKNLIGVISKGFIKKAIKTKEGYWYSYGNIELLGEYNYKLQKEECEKLSLRRDKTSQIYK